jgi:hypothetical protein
VLKHISFLLCVSFFTICWALDHFQRNELLYMALTTDCSDGILFKTWSRNCLSFRRPFYKVIWETILNIWTCLLRHMQLVWSRYNTYLSSMCQENKWYDITYTPYHCAQNKNNLPEEFCGRFWSLLYQQWTSVCSHLCLYLKLT